MLFVLTLIIILILTAMLLSWKKSWISRFHAEQARNALAEAIDEAMSEGSKLIEAFISAKKAFDNKETPALTPSALKECIVITLLDLMAKIRDYEVTKVPRANEALSQSVEDIGVFLQRLLYVTSSDALKEGKHSKKRKTSLRRLGKKLRRHLLDIYAILEMASLKDQPLALHTLNVSGIGLSVKRNPVTALEVFEEVIGKRVLNDYPEYKAEAEDLVITTKALREERGLLVHRQNNLELELEAIYGCLTKGRAFLISYLSEDDYKTVAAILQEVVNFLHPWAGQ